VLTSLMNLAVNLVAVAAFMALAGVPLRWSFLWFIPCAGLIVAFAFGLAMLLSALFVRYRDVQPIWDVVSMAAFYATPILYPLEAVRIEWARDFIMLNPLAVAIQQIRHAMFDPSVPNALEAAGGWGLLMIPLGLVAATCVIGFWYFNRAAPDVAENL
jgi:ABC-2 type transport system permease protein